VTSSKRPKTISIDGKSYYLTPTQADALGQFQRVEEAAAPIELKVLFLICENGVTRSEVFLGQELSDLMARPPLGQALRWILEGLNLNGWIVYSLGEHDLFINIKPTRVGYLVAGYPPPSMLVGLRRNYTSDSPKHPGDHTDFRTVHAFGNWDLDGRVEREGVMEHVLRYRSHNHHFAFEVNPHLHTLSDKLGVAPSQSQAHNGRSTAPPGGEAKGEGVMEMSASPAEIRADVRARLQRGEGVQAIREATGLGVGTIYRIRDDPNYKGPTEAGRARSNNLKGVRAQMQQAPEMSPGEVTSIQERIRAVLDSASGPMDAETLRQELLKDGKAETAGVVSLHSIVHVLYPMRRRREVEFNEKGRGASKRVVKIKLFGKSWREANQNERVWAPAAPPVESAPQPAQEAPQPRNGATVGAVPSPDLVLRWPGLAALLSRGTKARAAARLLREAGMNDAADLVEAEANSGIGSPLEQEFVDLVNYMDNAGQDTYMTKLLTQTPKE
jgi:hypothetical protein